MAEVADFRNLFVDTLRMIAELRRDVFRRPPSADTYNRDASR